MGDAGRVGVARAVFVNEGCVEFHVGGRCSRTLVLVRDADVVVATVLRNGCRHAVVVHGAVHAAAAGELTVVGVVVGGGTALALVGSIAEVSIGSTAGGPCPVVGSNVACTGRVGLAEGSGHVRDVDVFVRMVSFDGVMRVGATARLRAVAAIVGGDVLAEDDVSGAGCLGGVEHDGFFFQLNGWLVQFAHHPGSETSEENRNDGKGEATRGFHAIRGAWLVYELNGLPSMH